MYLREGLGSEMCGGQWLMSGKGAQDEDARPGVALHLSFGPTWLRS
jgi:hypothetical protein